jgi:hypothetical protein
MRVLVCCVVALQHRTQPETSACHEATAAAVVDAAAASKLLVSGPFSPLTHLQERVFQQLRG